MKRRIIKNMFIVMLLSQVLTYGNTEKYIVASGDTLAKISAKSGVPVDKLIKINKIKNPDLIYVGTKLKLIEDSKKEIDYRIHTVKRGDTLNKIAKYYDVDINQLIKINNIENPNLIISGMKIKIPNFLIELAIKYENESDALMKIKNYSLNYKIEKALNIYLIAEQIYREEDMDSPERLKRKIFGLRKLKEGITYENIGDIYNIKGEKEKARENYKKAFDNFQQFEENTGYIVPKVSRKLEKLRYYKEEK
ncbi:LysM peptidoglycan-binding domain-containing protein [Fusobacterium sp.]|uniref:LysM peptidoglycan-binding domain-containing protein n=1 Tax=Fusobacterium sp. TaxID=68766 RepID=UPI00262E6FA3|nr:LysM peptidoglycan-binding domain-containing protein [Fusobacterium sp.]